MALRGLARRRARQVNGSTAENRKHWQQAYRTIIRLTMQRAALNAIADDQVLDYLAAQLAASYGEAFVIRCAALSPVIPQPAIPPEQPLSAVGRTAAGSYARGR